MLTLRLVPGGYADGGTFVQVLEDGLPYGRLSTNLPAEPPLPPGVFWLCDWSECKPLATYFLLSGAIAIEPSIPPIVGDFQTIRAARVISNA